MGLLWAVSEAARPGLSHVDCASRVLVSLAVGCFAKVQFRVWR